MAYTIAEMAVLDVDALFAEEKARTKACACGDVAGENGLCYYCDMGEHIERHPIGRPGAVPAAPKGEQ